MNFFNFQVWYYRTSKSLVVFIIRLAKLIHSEPEGATSALLVSLCSDLTLWIIDSYSCVRNIFVFKKNKFLYDFFNNLYKYLKYIYGFFYYSYFSLYEETYISYTREMFLGKYIPFIFGLDFDKKVQLLIHVWKEVCLFFSFSASTTNSNTPILII